MDPDNKTLRPEELLAQLGWIRALARSLVFDPELTDDVLQDVCLLALEKAPPGARTGPRLRAWLSTVTRRLARRSGRSEARRSRRELAAARPEALPSTSDVSEHREALRLLVDAVTTLEEPHFTSVVERYFDGRSVAEIAARHEMTAAAVRQRLTRAKRQLRARLQRLLDDERVCRLLGVLPLASVGTPWKAFNDKAISHRGREVLAVRKAGTGGTMKAAAAVLIGAGLLFVTWRGLRGTEDAEASPARNVAGLEQPALPKAQLPALAVKPPTGLLADVGDTRPPAPAVGSSTVPAPVGQAPGLLRIVVIDSAAMPVEDAIVETLVQTGQMNPDGFSWWGATREPVASTTTDVLGRCTVSLSADAGTGIVVTKEGVGCSGIFGLERLEPMRHADGDTVIALVPQLAVRGQVVRADGAPVAGCTVAARQTGVFMEYGEPREPPVMTTDADGRFEGGADYSPQYTINARTSDGVQTRAVVDRKPGEPIELTLRMPGDWWIRGVVLDEAGAAVAGASVLAVRVPDDADADATWSLLTGGAVIHHREVGKAEADGSFALSVAEAGSYLVTAFIGQRPTAAPVRVAISGWTSRADVLLRLESPAEVSGVVLDTTGSAVPDALVTLRAVPPALLNGYASFVARVATEASTRSRKDGRFRFSSLPPHGSFDLRACPSARQEFGIASSPAIPCDTPWTRTVAGNAALVLTADFGDRPLGSIRATIVSAATGQLITKASWHVAAEGESEVLMAPFMRGMSNDEGVLVVPDLDPTATFTLSIAAEGYGFVDVHDISPSLEGTNVSIALPQLSSLQVEVVDDHGVAVPYARVEIHRSLEFRRDFLSSATQPRAADARGLVRFDALDPGSYSVRVTARDIDIEESVVVGDGAFASYRVVLAPEP